MANWPTPHLFAWFGTESCYLAMAAMPPPTRHGHATGWDLLRPLPWIRTKTILAEAARLKSAVQTKSPLSWDSSEAHGEAGVISYRANIIALPYRAQPLASGNRLIGHLKKKPR
jgi:hypothetical protein